MNKITLRINVRADDWTAEMSAIASNDQTIINVIRFGMDCISFNENGPSILQLFVCVIKICTFTLTFYCSSYVFNSYHCSLF